MRYHQICAEGARLCKPILGVGLCMGLGALHAAAEPNEMLRITVGKPTFLSADVNPECLAVSRTGIVAAFYYSHGKRSYRTSTDGARTWGEEMPSPMPAEELQSVGLRDGGVLFMEGRTNPVKDGKPGELEVKRDVFSDDFLHHEAGISKVFIPNAALNNRYASFFPYFVKGKIVQLTNGDLMTVMYGILEGDPQYRTLIVRSTDLGKTWRYDTTVAFNPNDPDPGLPGRYVGFCEPALALLSDGRFLCVMRTQGEAENGEYRPLYVSWSDSQGKTWSKPAPTSPHLMNIWPSLAVLDNGVVACNYGRPGFHVAFSADGGRTWQNRVSFSDLNAPLYATMSDMVKAGSNRLAVIGRDREGIKVWPIDVERVKVSPAQAKLTGRVLNQAGQPIVGAKVELGPNRYAADFWIEGKELDKLKVQPQPLPLSPPVLGYQAILKEKGCPIAGTDASGRFEFETVKLAEYTLTVEAEGFTPQWRHINVAPESQTHTQDFQLKAGRSIRGQVVDERGSPVGGACVVLDKCHVHADPNGFFCLAMDAPVPNEVTVKAYKRYDSKYATFEEKLPLLRIEKQPIVLRTAK